LEVKIRVFHADSHGIYGSPKIHYDLIDDGVRCSKNRVARTMREAGIRSRRRKKFKAITNSRHRLPVAGNLLDQDFTADTPDSFWVGDITYVPTQEGWLYLAVLIDLYNRKVAGWASSSRMTRQLALDALQMVLDRQSPGNGLVHQTDRGSQYASGDYQKVLCDSRIVCSMSRKGNCYDNAVAESFFGLLKTDGSTTAGIEAGLRPTAACFITLKFSTTEKDVTQHSAIKRRMNRRTYRLQLNPASTFSGKIQCLVLGIKQKEVSHET
jgi:transposase InsO family protein